jgi:hypothetical protein
LPARGPGVWLGFPVDGSPALFAKTVFTILRSRPLVKYRKMSGESAIACKSLPKAMKTLECRNSLGKCEISLGRGFALTPWRSQVRALCRPFFPMPDKRLDQKSCKRFANGQLALMGDRSIFQAVNFPENLQTDLQTAGCGSSARNPPRVVGDLRDIRRV